MRIPPTTDRLGQVLYRLSSILAVCGGLILVLLILMSCLSILGRVLFATPLNGDFELIEMGSALAIFAFLPWAHLQRGHIRIELFAAPRVCAFLDSLADAIFLLFSLALVIYLTQGGYSAYMDNSLTVVLGLRLWWGFAGTIINSCLLLMVCAYSFWMSCRRFLQLP